MGLNPSKIHNKLEALLPYIHSVRDVLFGGEPVVKNGPRADIYLPSPPGGDVDSGMRYTNYKDNALFYALAERVFDGLQGACFRKDPEVFIDKSMVPLLDVIYKGNDSLFTLCKKALSETLAVSRFGVLCDWLDGAELPTLLSYRSENIINWRYGVVNGRYQLILVVLREVIQKPMADDFFTEQDQVQYRVLQLVPKSIGGVLRHVYQSTVYVKNTTKEGSVYFTELTKTKRIPQKKGGNYWERIPFTICTATPDAIISTPLMLPIVSANLSHYRSSAAYENLVNITGFPILWGAGIKKKEAPSIYIGEPKAHLFEDPSASLSFASAPKGADIIKGNMEAKKELIVLLGGRLLQREREAVESAQTHKEKKLGENSVLATVIKSVSNSLSCSLQDWVDYQGATTAKAYIELNTDFTADALSPATLNQLSDMYDKGDISFSTYWYNMKKFELYPDNWKKEDELSELASSSFKNNKADSISSKNDPEISTSDDLGGN